MFKEFRNGFITNTHKQQIEKGKDKKPHQAHKKIQNDKFPTRVRIKSTSFRILYTLDDGPSTEQFLQPTNLLNLLPKSVVILRNSEEKI